MPRQSRHLNVPLAPSHRDAVRPWHTKTHASLKNNTCMRIPQALKQAYSQGYPESAMHVQESIGSRNSAIHNDYHTSLRPSSMLEPRYPSLKVVRCARSKTHIGRLKQDSERESWFRDTMATGTSLGKNTCRDVVSSLPCHPRAPRMRQLPEDKHLNPVTHSESSR